MHCKLKNRKRTVEQIRLITYLQLHITLEMTFEYIIEDLLKSITMFCDVMSLLWYWYCIINILAIEFTFFICFFFNWYTNRMISNPLILTTIKTILFQIFKPKSFCTLIKRHQKYFIVFFTSAKILKKYWR